MKRWLGSMQRLWGMFKALLLVRGCTQKGWRVCLFGRIAIYNRGRLHLGTAVTFLEGLVPVQLRCEKEGVLHIGSRTMFAYGVQISSRNRVEIGSHCMFAPFVSISDFHNEGVGVSKPIIIEDNVWVAHGAVIRPGVRIGEGSVVAAGSVVETDIPKESLAIGNPARAIHLDMVAR